MVQGDKIMYKISHGLGDEIVVRNVTNNELLTDVVVLEPYKDREDYDTLLTLETELRGTGKEKQLTEFLNKVQKFWESME